METPPYEREVLQEVQMPRYDNKGRENQYWRMFRDSCLQRAAVGEARKKYVIPGNKELHYRAAAEADPALCPLFRELGGYPPQPKPYPRDMPAPQQNPKYVPKYSVVQQQQQPPPQQKDRAGAGRPPPRGGSPPKRKGSQPPGRPAQQGRPSARQHPDSGGNDSRCSSPSPAQADRGAGLAKHGKPSDNARSRAESASPQHKKREFRIVEGALVDYKSRSVQDWVPARINGLDPETGNVELDVKRGCWISPKEQEHCLRPRTMPQPRQKDLIRSLVSDGSAERWGAKFFQRYCQREQRLNSNVLRCEDFDECARDVERELGVSGVKVVLITSARKLGKQYISEADFHKALWDMLVNAATEYTERVDKDYILQQGAKADVDIHDHYEFLDVLGKGSFGEVSLASQKATGMRRAIKSIRKDADPDVVEEMELEIEMLKTMDHPYIVKLYEHYEDANFMYLVMDFCSGGDLNHTVKQHCERNPSRYFDEAYVAEIMRQLLTAVYHMHCHGVLHLDLKLQNIMLTPSKSTIAPSDDNATMRNQSIFARPHCMIIDLGVSKFFKAGSPELAHPVGTPMTMAPEVWQGKFSPKADVFSLGTVMFCLSAFKYPYNGIPAGGRRAVNDYYMRQPKVDWNDISHMSSKCRELCASMLKIGSSARPFANKCLEHDFITLNRLEASDGGADWINADDLPDSIIRRLKKAPRRSVLYKSVAVSIARLWPANQMPVIKDSFLQLDRKGALNGRLSKSVVRDELMKHGVDQLEAQTCAEAVDFNRDGVIDWTEWAATCIPLGDLEKELQAVFESADVNQDGLLSGEDLSRMLAMDNCNGRMLTEVLVELVQREGPSVRVDWHNFRDHFESKTKKEQARARALVNKPPEPHAKEAEDQLWEAMMDDPPSQFKKPRGLMDRTWINMREAVGAIEPGAVQSWRSNMAVLRGMGFKDPRTCRDFLIKHNNIISSQLIEELHEQNTPRRTHEQNTPRRTSQSTRRPSKHREGQSWWPNML